MMPAILGGDDTARIHAGSLKTLESVGVRVDDPAVLDVLRRAGARDGEDALTVRLPSELVGECLSRCPAGARFADRMGGVTEVGPAGGSPAP